MMALFNVALLLELGEERVGTACQGRGRQQRAIAIVGGGGLSSGLIVVEDKAVCWPATTACGGRQSGLLFGTERYEFPMEVTPSVALAEELDDTALDLLRVV